MTSFKLPDLGEGLPDAEIHQWYVAEGEEVHIDQPLVAMETAKAVVDVPSPYTGKVVKLYGKVGDIIPTGEPLIEIAVEGKQETYEKDAGTVVGALESTDTILVESPTGVEVKKSIRSSIKAMPAVRALAHKLNVDLNSLSGTGPGGSITAGDVTQASLSAAPVVMGDPLHGARRVMAQQMAKSHAEVVPVTLVEDADIAAWPEHTDVTVRIIRAIVAACHAEPSLNAHFFGATLSRQLYKEINLGIAVNTANGLYVPVIKDVAQQSNESIRDILNTFKTKAAQQSFSPDDMKHATITLSNFGTIAGRYANPIVVPPTVAIIGIGKTRSAVVVAQNKSVVHPIMPLSLTCDHRAVAGAEAAVFLAALIKDLEQGPHIPSPPRSGGRG